MATTTSSSGLRTLPALYRHILRTSRSTFQNDDGTMTAWRTYVRQRMATQAATVEGSSPDGKLSQSFVDEWLDVEKILRMNVVQGVRKEGKDDVYQLKFTSDTELGNNDSIKKGRQQQLDELKASKGVLRCGGSAASASASSSSSSPSPSSNQSQRSFSTSARLLNDRSAEKSKPAPRFHVPHPPPQFPSTTLLSDGSSITMTTTSPRSIARLTRDTSNHPLWNPVMLDSIRGGSAGGGEDEAGRMERFRRRFASVEDDAPENKEAVAVSLQEEGEAPSRRSDAQQATKGKAAKSAAGKAVRGDETAAGNDAGAAAARTRRQGAMFDLDDLDWMSGGREAHGKAAPVKPGKKKK